MKFLITLFFLLTIHVFAKADVLDSYIDSIPEQEVSAQWISKTAHKTVNEQRAIKLARATYAHALDANVNPTLILAILHTESGFRNNVRSVEGAVGIAQVIPKFHKDKIKGRNPSKDEVSLEVGILILKQCLEQHNNNMVKALGKCYSGGAGKKYYNKVMAYQKALNIFVKLNLSDPVVATIP